MKLGGSQDSRTYGCDVRADYGINTFQKWVYCLAHVHYLFICKASLLNAVRKNWIKAMCQNENENLFLLSSNHYSHFSCLYLSVSLCIINYLEKIACIPSDGFIWILYLFKLHKVSCVFSVSHLIKVGPTQSDGCTFSKKHVLLLHKYII